MKTIFLIPGFMEDAAGKRFDVLGKFLKNKGFRVIKVPINWRGKTNSECAKEFKEFYSIHKSAEENHALGFSYGAVIAFITAKELNVKKLYLCSLSPDFKEDVPFMKNWIKKYIGKKRISDAMGRSGNEIAKKLNIPTILFYGEIEGRKFPSIKIRAEETHSLLKKSKLIVVKNAPHDINNSEYLKSIKSEFQ